MKNIKSLVLIVVLLLLTCITLFAGINTKMYTAYAMFGLGILAMLAYFVSIAISNVKVLIWVGLVGVLFLLFYFIAPSNDVPQALYEKTGTSESWSPIITGSLYTIYSLCALFVLVFFGTIIRNATRK